MVLFPEKRARSLVCRNDSKDVKIIFIRQVSLLRRIMKVKVFLLSIHGFFSGIFVNLHPSLKSERYWHQ